MGEKTLTTHGCGKSWLQRGERTGHCGGCHETFEGNRLFDAHFERVEGGVRCRDPREMEFDGAPLIFDGTYGDGSWRADSSKWVSRRFGAKGGVTTAPAPVSAPEGRFLEGAE